MQRNAIRNITVNIIVKFIARVSTGNHNNYSNYINRIMGHNYRKNLNLRTWVLALSALILPLITPSVGFSEPDSSSDISYPVIPLDPTQPKATAPTRTDPHLMPTVKLPGGLFGILPVDAFIFRLVKVGQSVQWTIEQTYKNTASQAIDEFITDFAPRDANTPPPDRQDRKDIHATGMILQKTVEYCFTHGLPEGPQGYVNYRAQKKPPVEQYTQLRSIIEHKFPHIFPVDMSINAIHYIEYAMVDACLKAADISTHQVLSPPHKPINNKTTSK